MSGFAGLCVAAFESRMAAEMARLIGRHGGRPLVAPALREVPLEDNREALRFGDDLLAGRFDLMILLTGVGTRTLADVLTRRHPADQVTAALGRLTLVVRGPKPAAALRELGLSAQITVPDPNTWHDILDTLDQRYGASLSGLRIAVQDYGVPNHDLLAALRDRGADVTHVPVYRWALPEDLAPLMRTIDAILHDDVAVVLITNAVQIDHVMAVARERGTEPAAGDRFRDALNRAVTGSIGPTASERLRTHGIHVDFEPSRPRMGLLVKELSERVHDLRHAKRPSVTDS